MKFVFLLVVLLGCCTLFGQGGYYFKTAGDTVFCEFKKVYPTTIKITSKQEKNLWIAAEEISGFTKDGFSFVSKQIVNQKKNPYIFLPDDKTDRRYKFSDAILDMISGNGLTVYQVEEFGGVSKYGRDIYMSLYVENDSLGLSKVPLIKLIGRPNQSDVIKFLRSYLKNNKATESKLNSMESWNGFDYKAIRNLIEEFAGKKLKDVQEI